jgi:hypothetical protein
VARLLITHTDRDGILSGAMLLRGLSGHGDVSDVLVLLTQGAYLAEELEELVAAGYRFRRMLFTDTYWVPAQAARICEAIERLRAPGADVEWFDHHPSTAENERWMREHLRLAPRSLIIGDRGKPGRRGRRESVSIVREAFGLSDEGSVRLEQVARGGRGVDIAALHREPDVAPWLAAIDGLSFFPEYPPEYAADLVRGLMSAFAEPPPAHSVPLQEQAREATRNVGRALMDGKFPSFPTVDRGCGVLVDLRPWHPVNAYSLQWELFAGSQGRIDLLLSLESGMTRHYVSGARARQARDAREGTNLPRLRVATFHRGSRRQNHGRRRRALDLRGLICRAPAKHLVRWIDAHPYLIKAEWREGRGRSEEEVRELCALVQAEAQRFVSEISWSDEDRYRPYLRRRVPMDPS